MEIQQMTVADLIPYAMNSRTHSDEQVAQIAASIREFGWTNPILIDADGGIIAGHGRLLAARKLGMTEVPCIELAHLTEMQKRAYVIADNKLALNAGWDDETLRLELEALLDVDFDMDLVGFSQDELDALLPEPIPEGRTDEDSAPDVQADAVTKPGDVWLMGKHRLMCGDVVLDSFGGSGTTLIAAEKNGRIARLMELDPRYCDVIVRRWQEYTGKQATLEADGRAFGDVEQASSDSQGD